MKRERTGPRKLLEVAGIATALGGVLGAVNRRMRAGALTPIGLAGDVMPMRVRGSAVFAVAFGGDGRRLLLLHDFALGGSSDEFRALCDELTSKFRIVAFDFLGCGRSDQPKIRYDGELVDEQVRAALNGIDGDVTIIASGAAVPFAVRAAAHDDARVRAIVAISPRLTPELIDLPTLVRQTGDAIVRSPLIGESLFNLFASQPSLRRILAQRYVGGASEEQIRQITALLARPGARYFPAAIFGGTLDCDATSDLPFLDTAMLVIGGELDERRDEQDFIALGRATEHVVISNARRFPHVDQPASTAAAIAAFLEREETETPDADVACTAGASS